ncbi:2-dehydro-3-deoxyphosphogluconate aldolase/4-hydroxy-2-oxoglutarate aldolase [Tolumonas auensis DSM 9187]|uniref:2-dehydro-3-deoxy-phosphogluconate aldolase n=1 Tax=Tolumonas auensis (strain DSM 9187 / NBRC 110442 / TA 4) TaxID=595494 RepID=C4L8I9_TOLAT|nr:bifunctional 4-hydroxy-2-oxoglutarate aldolase/2-dehydro-3-deoxy-phosphogluconate aldolase [Tolumonas auensis]ACQ91859.1 2-dehydro-3-deoxyphosphogluconate aldolase/4-hydroxy-2-oxoglutarate aldolase [Tolumonas auensis DSM 9187]
MSWQVEPAAVFAASPVVPVMVIKRVEDAVPMAKALAEGGITVFEITLRTPAALDAIRAIAAALPETQVGAGTVLTPEQYDAAVEAGAKFIISPGYTRTLMEHAKKGPSPLIPGVATPSEIMTALELGYDHLKFFPAEANGGAAALKAIAAPLAQVKFCPTGGVSPKNVADYVALGCVATVGGTWMLPADAINTGDWATITELTQKAVELVNSLRR